MVLQLAQLVPSRLEDDWAGVSLSQYPTVRCVCDCKFVDVSVCRGNLDRAVICRASYQSPLWFDKWSVLAVHLVVEAAGVAEIVAVAVPPPERGGGRPAVDALPTLCNRAGIRVQSERVNSTIAEYKENDWAD